MATSSSIKSHPLSDAATIPFTDEEMQEWQGAWEQDEVDFYNHLSDDESGWGTDVDESYYEDTYPLDNNPDYPEGSFACKDYSFNFDTSEYKYTFRGVDHYFKLGQLETLLATRFAHKRGILHKDHHYDEGDEIYCRAEFGNDDPDMWTYFTYTVPELAQFADYAEDAYICMDMGLRCQAVRDRYAAAEKGMEDVHAARWPDYHYLKPAYFNGMKWKKPYQKPKGTNKSPVFRYRCKKNNKTNTATSSVKLASRMFKIGVSTPAPVVRRLVMQSAGHFVKQECELMKAKHTAEYRDNARYMRDERQRQCAIERAKEAYKADRKEHRERQVKNAIEAKLRRHQELIEPQGLGHIIKSTVGGVLAAGFGKICFDKTTAAVNNKVKEMSEKVQGVFKQVTDTLKKVFGTVFFKVPLVFVAWWLFTKYFPGDGIFKHVLAGIVACYLLEDEAIAFQKFMDTKIEQQSNSCNVAAFLATFMCLSVFKGGHTQKHQGEFMKRVGSYDRSVTGIEGLLAWVTKSVKSILSYVVALTTGGRVKIFEQIKTPFEEWVVKTEACICKFRLFKEAEGAGAVDEVMDLLQEGFTYRTLYQHTDTHKDVVRLVSELSSVLKPFAGVINARNNRRFEPHMAVILGDPGIGKTVMAMEVVSAVLKLSGLMPDAVSEADIAKEVWQKGTSEYWNGYGQQLALIMDDAFQCKASLMTEENDYFNVIKAVGSWAMPLNMADLESKGRIYFKSKFIYATTNVTNIKCEAVKVLHSPDAVTRRFRHAYKLFIKPEYMRPGTTELNHGAFEEESYKLATQGHVGFNAFPWHMWEVSAHDYLEGTTAKTRFPLRGVVLKMARDLKHSLSAHESRLEALNSYVRDMQTLDQLDAVDIIPQGFGFKIPFGHKPTKEEISNMAAAAAVTGTCAAIPPAMCGPDVYTKKRESFDFKKWYADTKEWAREHKAMSAAIGTLCAGFWVAFHGPIFAIIKATLKALKQMFFPSSDYRGGKKYEGQWLTYHNYRTIEHIRARVVSDMEISPVNVNMAAVTLFVHRKKYRVLGYSYFPDQSVLDDTTVQTGDFQRIFKFTTPVYYFPHDVLEAAGFKLPDDRIPKMYNCEAKPGEPLGTLHWDDMRWESNTPAPQLKVVKIKKLTDVQFQSNVVVPSPVTTPEVKNELHNIYSSVHAIIHKLRDGSVRQWGNFMMLVDTMGVMPKHYRTQFDKQVALGNASMEDEFQLVNTANPGSAICVPCKEFWKLPHRTVADSDMEFINFKSVCKRNYRDITGLFIKEADITGRASHPVRLDVPRFGPDAKFTRVIETAKSLKYEANVVAQLSYARLWKYGKVNTELGDCGSPLTMAHTSACNGRICLGFHVAAHIHDLDGYSVILTQEVIEAARKAMNVVRDNFVGGLQQQGFTIHPTEEDPLDNMGSFQTIGVINQAYNSPKNTKFRIVEEVYGMFGEYNYAPARLGQFRTDAGMVYPMVNALEPYQGPIHLYFQPWLEQAIHLALQPLSSLSVDATREILTFEKAVKGDPMMKLRGLPRGTSAGFPYALTVRDGKKSFFGADGEFQMDTPAAKEIESKVQEMLDLASQNVRSPVVFIDFLKDELRPVEKVEAGKTRLISCAPMVYTIAVRRMFGAFTSAFFRFHTVSGMCPGICAYTDWAKLFKHVQQKGLKIFDGDFKGFDSSEQAHFLMRICHAINRWYDDGEENARIREVLFLDLIHSRHLGGRGDNQCYLIQWNRSLPSGHPLTTVVNSIYSLATLIGCYIAITGDAVHFWQKVAAATYGDDNLVNPDDQTADVYNQVTVAQTMQDEFGLTYTSGRKNGELEPYTTIGGVTFLQRGFRIEDGEVYSPLNLDSFLYTPYHCKNQMLKQQIINDTMEKSLEELSQHPEATWDEYAPRIISFLKKRVGSTRAAPDRKEYQKLIRTYADHWY